MATCGVVKSHPTQFTVVKSATIIPLLFYKALYPKCYLDAYDETQHATEKPQQPCKPTRRSCLETGVCLCNKTKEHCHKHEREVRCQDVIQKRCHNSSLNTCGDGPCRRLERAILPHTTIQVHRSIAHRSEAQPIEHSC